MADGVTVLRNAGPPGTKRNIVVLGDGFAVADQATYNQWVDTTLIKGVFGHDCYSEDASAYNIYRLWRMRRRRTRARADGRGLDGHRARVRSRHRRIRG